MERPSSPLTHVAPADMPDDLRAMHATSLDVVGEAERIEVFATHPDLYRWYHENFYRKLFENGDGTMLLERRWKELIRLKMSLSHGCFVCNSFNVPSALAAGFTQAQIDAVLDPAAELFTPAELAVLELGEQIAMQNLDGALTPELHERLGRHFSDAEILELGVIAAMLTGWTKLMFTFDLVTREDSCPIGVARPQSD
ncbi:MAG: Carboxymuconolactone decarboxylase [Pseudonocardiales bacterium]|nr:Carboxymuconolactone decarboxylase [Pseudonocardiales bacterium]